MSDFQGAGEPITKEGFISTVESLGLKVPELLAVLAIETQGCGFLSNRSPAILFEPHVFHRQTNGRFDAEAPDLSNAQQGGAGAVTTADRIKNIRPALLQRF